jgi:hypothetical protein
MIADIFKNYDKKKLLYPTKGSKEADFDDYIAVWADYFSKKFELQIPKDTLKIIQDLNGEAKAENSCRHHYYMYILDDKNNVFKAQYPTDQDIDSCMDHLKKIEKIFKNFDTVTMCIRGDINKKDPDLKRLVDFKQLGKHSGGGQLLDFDSICNSKGCYSINETWIDTCPGFLKHHQEPYKKPTD